MRNNSLRQQAWQNKQQANIFKKVTQLTPNLALDENQPPLVLLNSYKTNQLQHSELKWLQKIMNDMNNFKERQKADSALKQKLVDTNTQVPAGNPIQYQTAIDGQKKNMSKESKRGGFKQDESKKSGIKLKFQIISNKENRVSLQKRGLYVTSCKHSDKIKSKSSKKIIPPTISKSKQKLKDKQVESNIKRQKQILDIPKMVTESFSIQGSFQVKNSQSLWKNEVNEVNKEKSHLVDSKEKPKMSVGKIVKNSLNETIIQQIASKMFKKSPQKQSNNSFLQKQQLINKNAKESDRKRPQKVFIKLETQKLSKYLMQQSEVKEVSSLVQLQKLDHLESEQFTKYCPTKRGAHIFIRAVNTSLNSESEIKIIDKTQKIQRKKNVERNMKTNNSFNNVQKRQSKTNSKYLSFNKQKQKINDSVQGQAAIKGRAKSQQRKLNQLPRALPQNESFLWQTKPSQPQQMPSFSFKNIELSCKDNQASEIQENQFLKLNYSKLQQKLQRKKSKVQQSQKIFTLNSDREQSNQKNHLEFIQARQEQKPSQINAAFRQSMFQNFNFVSKRSFYCQTQNDNTIKSTQKHQQTENLQQKSTIDSQNEHYCQQLKQLFNFLDEGKRSLLISSNCKAEELTEELKLLLSPIIYQIKSKKQSYNLEKFIAEGQQILKVKQEVYKTSRAHLKKSNISQILKQNIQLLIKKAPFDFLHQTHTYSYYESIENSKRESTKDTHSIVISKLITDQKAKSNRVVEPGKKSIVQERKLQQQQIDLSQPEFYFQKKYGIGSWQLKYQGKPSSNFPQFIVGAFKDQQSFWKK